MHAPAATRDRVVRCCHLRGRTVNATDRFFYNASPERFPCLRFHPLSREDVPRFATSNPPFWRFHDTRLDDFPPIETAPSTDTLEVARRADMLHRLR